MQDDFLYFGQVLLLELNVSALLHAFHLDCSLFYSCAVSLPYFLLIDLYFVILGTYNILMPVLEQLETVLNQN